MVVHRTNQHLYVQVVNDKASHTLAATSTLAKNLRETCANPNIEAAKAVGVEIARVRWQRYIRRFLKKEKISSEIAHFFIFVCQSASSYTQICKEKGITTVKFDRAGYRYHGRIQVLADAAREGGLDF